MAGRIYWPVSCEGPDTLLRSCVVQGWVQPSCQTEEQTGMSTIAFPVALLRSLFGAYHGSAQLVLHSVLELMKFNPQSLCSLAPKKDLVKLQVRPGNLSSLQYSSLCSLNYRARKAFSSLLPFSAVDQVPLPHLFGSLSETA